MSATVYHCWPLYKALATLACKWRLEIVLGNQLVKLPWPQRNTRQGPLRSSGFESPIPAIYFVRFRSRDLLRQRPARIAIKLAFLSLSAISREADTLRHLISVDEFLQVGQLERFLRVALVSACHHQLELNNSSAYCANKLPTVYINRQPKACVN